MWTEELVRDLRKKAEKLQPELAQEVENLAGTLEGLDLQRRYAEALFAELREAR